MLAKNTYTTAQPVVVDVQRPEPPTKPPPEPLREWTKEELKRIRKVQKRVKAASQIYNIDTDIINAIIWVESKFERMARSSAGPRGLMQLMPRTAKIVAKELKRKYRPYSSDFSIKAGTFYFAKMLEVFDGNMKLALEAYHRGPGRVNQRLEEGLPVPEKSEQYIEDVFQAAKAFRQRDLGKHR